MWFYDDEMIAAARHEHRSRLLAEAENHRLARQVQQNAPKRRYTRLLLGALLASAGAHLLHWGQRLQAHHTDLPPGAQTIYPA